jgi:hypothetical protein
VPYLAASNYYWGSSVEQELVRRYNDQAVQNNLACITSMNVAAVLSDVAVLHARDILAPGSVFSVQV